MPTHWSHVLAHTYTQLHMHIQTCVHNLHFVPLHIHKTPYLILQDTRFAAEAMARLQGIMLLSSERGGMRIEFAKHKMAELVSNKLQKKSFQA